MTAPDAKSSCVLLGGGTLICWFVPQALVWAVHGSKGAAVVSLAGPGLARPGTIQMSRARVSALYYDIIYGGYYFIINLHGRESLVPTCIVPYTPIRYNNNK